YVYPALSLLPYRSAHHHLSSLPQPTALPIEERDERRLHELRSGIPRRRRATRSRVADRRARYRDARAIVHHDDARIGERRDQRRSEEHTSELQSLTNLVCRLLLEKKTLQPAN